MGRIVAPVRIENVTDKTKSILVNALVDTGSSYLVLPSAWKERLGKFESERKVNLELTTQDITEGEICGPVKIQIEGFPVIHNDVLFVDMKPKDGFYEPLVGYIIVEQSQAAVDMVGHRLVHLKSMDLK